MASDFSLLRAELIDKSREELLEYGKSYQRIVSRMLRDEWMPSLDVNKDGTIRATAKNSAKVAAIDKIMRQVQQRKGGELVDWFTRQVEKIENYSFGYFERLSPDKVPAIQKSGERALRKLFNRLGYDGEKALSGGFLYDLAAAPEPVRKLKAQAFRAVGQGINFTEFQNQMNVFIAGQGKQGLFETHLRTAAYDSFAQFDRQINNQMASDLGYKRARYAGGLMDTSRDFCTSKVGRIFTMEEIQAWADQNWDGKSVPYDPVLDLGGYNCTHILEWLPPKPEADRRAKEAASDEITGETIKEMKPQVKDILSVNSGMKVKRMYVDKSLEPDDFKDRANHFRKLMGDYDIEQNAGEISLSFKSSRNTFGFVEYSPLNPFSISHINLGHRYSETRTQVYKGTFRPKSRVDKSNLKYSTVTHEFAHVIARKNKRSIRRAPKRYKEFWRELEEVSLSYYTELKSLRKENNWSKIEKIDLGLYSSKNLNEFFAEGFTEYKLTSKPSKYAKMIGELADKYFRK